MSLYVFRTLYKMYMAKLGTQSNYNDFLKKKILDINIKDILHVSVQTQETHFHIQFEDFMQLSADSVSDKKGTLP